MDTNTWTPINFSTPSLLVLKLSPVFFMLYKFVWSANHSVISLFQNFLKFVYGVHLSTFLGGWLNVSILVSSILVALFSPPVNSCHFFCTFWICITIKRNINFCKFWTFICPNGDSNSNFECLHLWYSMKWWTGLLQTLEIYFSGFKYGTLRFLENVYIPLFIILFISKFTLIIVILFFAPMITLLALITFIILNFKIFIIIIIVILSFSSFSSIFIMFVLQMSKSVSSSENLFRSRR